MIRTEVQFDASAATPPAGAQLTALTAHLARTRVVSTLIWGGSLGLYNVLVVLSYPAFKHSINHELSQLPPPARALFGIQGTGASIESWLAINTFNLIAPLALAFLPIIMGARAIAGREERQSMDLLLGNPLPRWVLVAATGGAMAVELLGTLVLFGLLTWLPAVSIAVHLPLTDVLAGVLNLWPLCLWFGALALLCSALFRQAALAIAIPAALLLAMYVAEALGSVSASVRFLRALSLFHYYGSAVEHGVPWISFIAIALLALLLLVLAIFAFDRRDIYA